MKKSTLAVDTRGSVTRTPGVGKRDAKKQSAKKKAKIYAIGTCLPKRHNLDAFLANRTPGRVNVVEGLIVNGMKYWKASTISQHRRSTSDAAEQCMRLRCAEEVLSQGGTYNFHILSTASKGIVPYSGQRM